MIKKSIYPKTKRLSDEREVIVTEKLDGSNLCFFKKDNAIYMATRNNILHIEEDLEDCGNILYKGMRGWLDENLEILSKNLREGSVVCGEWLGMGKLKYPYFDKKFYMFAKANIDEDFSLKNINYNQDFFKYCFENEYIPEIVGVVPVVGRYRQTPTIENLDELYDMYVKHIQRDVEGFVIVQGNSADIKKYVRMKNGKIEPHFS